MKNILIISEFFPFPPYLNGEISTLYHLIKSSYLSDQSVDLLYLENQRNENEDVFIEDIKHIYRIPAIKKEITISINGTKILKPRGIWGISCREFEGFDASKYDFIVYGSMIEACINSKICGERAVRIIFAADSPILMYSQKMVNEKKWINILYYQIQMKVCKTYEHLISQQVDKIVYVSEIDTNVVREYLEGVDIRTARIGVDEFPKQFLHRKGGKIELGFSGLMTYRPNHLAVDFIINRVLPILDNRNIDYHMHIIGKDPDRKWITIAEKNERVTVTGFIDDIDTYIAGMDIYISPLFVGSGMKNKILQALSIGVPIIASKTSVDGISGMRSGENFWLCDENPEKWADMIVELYNNYEKRVLFTNNGRKLIKEEYSWDRFARELLENDILY